MSRETALLTFAIGPVHTFIAQARRVADLWAGSDLLSHLIRTGIGSLRRRGDCQMLFPHVGPAAAIPWGLPNRFVCRIPRSEAESIAVATEAAVRAEWDRWVERTVALLRSEPYRFDVHETLWSRQPRRHQPRRQTDAVLDVAWSWVPEDGDYASASLDGARQFVAARRFRPFLQIEERGEKCAVCGERTALPDGNRHAVRSQWQRAEDQAPERDQGFFRLDQTRLCLVCTTKRLYPRLGRRNVRFKAFDHFEPAPAELAEGDGPPERDPYFALVAMDGDRMGDILGWQAEEVVGGDVEAFHREVSRVLTRFARDLRQRSGRRIDARGRRRDPQGLDLETLGYDAYGDAAPQLIYAGGEDVLFVADPRDALPLARRIRELYRQRFEAVRPLLTDPDRYSEFTISAGVLYAHTKHPAGLLFRDVHRLLDEQAKDAAGRDAVALRLVKRGGVPVEVAFKWGSAEAGEPGWVERFNRVVALVRREKLASRQTFNLRREETTLTQVFKSSEQWVEWLADRLSRGDVSSDLARELAVKLTPFFMHGKAAALRIARFLGREVPE